LIGHCVFCKREDFDLKRGLCLVDDEAKGRSEERWMKRARRTSRRMPWSMSMCHQ
jgi:hypothetical protein